jgi:hypothetical protein
MLTRVDPKKVAKAARDKRYRERCHTSVMTFVGEVGEAELDWLIRHRYLDARELDHADGREARRLVGSAVSRLLKASARAS